MNDQEIIAKLKENEPALRARSGNASQDAKLTVVEQEIILKGRISRQVEDLDDDALKAIANATVPVTDTIDEDINEK